MIIILLLFAFLAGLVTILAPCIWPVLPIVLSSSIGGEKGRLRPLGITLGIILSFTIFTLFISYLVSLFHFDANWLRLAAVVIIAFLGLCMIIPGLSAKFEIMVTKLSNFFSSKTNTNSGFLPGFITGVSLGIVWSPCAGPILAAIATLSATRQVSFTVVLITLAYICGAAIPLFAISYGSQKFIKKTRFLDKYTGGVQKLFGAVCILMAVLIYTNLAQTLQLKLLNRFPILDTAFNGFENSSLVKTQLNNLTGNNSSQKINNGQLFNVNYPAADFSGITNWLNTDKPLSLKDLKGKVVLVDFWTYTCINCIRTLPHVTTWYDKYKNDGFVVIGVHTPEFQFEHNTANVENAIKMYNIHYPVAQDNNYATWGNYHNEYWPAEYLIDAQGNVRRTDFGEGEYQQMEMAIQELLKQTGEKINSQLSDIQDQTPQTLISPETYLGSARMEYYYPLGSLSNGSQNFTLSDNLPQNSFSYGGTWTISDEFATVGQGASLNYHFIADKVYVILRPPLGSDLTKETVQVFLDGQLISPTEAGADVKNGIVTVDSDRLYSLVDLHGKTEDHLLKLQFQTPGTQVYTFTFG